MELCGNANDANAGIHLKHVDVEVDGGVECGEQVGDAGHVLHPGRPDHLLLNRGYEKHSGEISNKCNQCDYASNQAGNLKKQSIRHSGEKPNKCNQCDYASSSVADLARHLKTHSGEKINKCNQCDYASSQANNLRTHLKSHNKLK